MVSAVLLIYSSFNNKAQVQMLNALKTIKNGAVEQLPDSVQERFPASEIPEGEIVHIEEVEDPVPVVSSSRNEYVDDDGDNYVLIEGKYYKARSDNTYMVDGRKIFYVNNRRYKLKDIKAGAIQSASNDVNESVESTGAGDSATKRSVAKAPLVDIADVPTSTEEMLKKMQQRNAHTPNELSYLYSTACL